MYTFLLLKYEGKIPKNTEKIPEAEDIKANYVRFEYPHKLLTVMKKTLKRRYIPPRGKTKRVKIVLMETP